MAAQRIKQRIIEKIIWIGETAEELHNSLGLLVDISGKSLSRKSKFWKLAQRGRNRFRLRITVEDGILVGWDSRND